MDKLIEKYDKPGPRYTSYPALPFWNNTLTTTDWTEHISKSVKLDGDKGVDLYIHIPYCEKLCWYCGCNRTITKNKSKSLEYVKALLNEWSFYTDHFKDLKIHSVHFGGGTPTFLSPEEFEMILSKVSPYFTENFIGSIEVDPRTCTEDQVKVLQKYSFKRASLGIQDFDPLVQKYINRHQDFDLVKGIVELLRSHDFNSINFDLIYGLPGQSEKSVIETIKSVELLDPDLLAFYSYAHLPDKIKNQRLIDESLLPNGAEKRKLYDVGKELLERTGFVEIGMDHFAKVGNFLEVAYQKKKLYRSFMGYSDMKTNTLIGIGATSISNTPFSFRQNNKDIKSYITSLENPGIPEKVTSHMMSSEDMMLASFVQELMCNDEATLVSEYDQTKLNSFLKDNLIKIDAEKIFVTKIGKVFVRNIAMAFDPYLNGKNHQRFSRTV